MNKKFSEIKTWPFIKELILFAHQKFKGLLKLFDATFSFSFLFPFLTAGILVLAQTRVDEYIKNAEILKLIINIVIGILASYFGASSIQQFNKIFNQESDVTYQKGLTSVRTLQQVSAKQVLIKNGINELVKKYKSHPEFISDLNSIKQYLIFLELDIINAIRDWQDMFPNIEEAIKLTADIQNVDSHNIREILNEIQISTQEQKASNRTIEKNTQHLRSEFNLIKSKIGDLGYPYEQFVASGLGNTGVGLLYDYNPENKPINLSGINFQTSLNNEGQTSLSILKGDTGPLTGTPTKR